MLQFTTQRTSLVNALLFATKPVVPINKIITQTIFVLLNVIFQKWLDKVL